MGIDMNVHREETERNLRKIADQVVRIIQPAGISVKHFIMVIRTGFHALETGRRARPKPPRA